eukprot:scaffold208951_cov37-Prasinocladus_malaysianus.AAC.1
MRLQVTTSIKGARSPAKETPNDLDGRAGGNPNGPDGEIRAEDNNGPDSSPPANAALQQPHQRTVCGANDDNAHAILKFSSCLSGVLAGELNRLYLGDRRLKIMT